jgi:hypothetical protein
VNFAGVDVGSLDVEAFVWQGRVVYVLVALAWIAGLPIVNRPAWLLLGVGLANAHAWLITNWPLQRLYALGPSSDRLNNLSWCQVVAAGHSPLYTAQLGHVQLEPFWSLLMAGLSGGSPERLLAIYAWMPLVTAVAVALSVFYATRPLAPGSDPAHWTGWERAAMAGFATLLFSAPWDFAGVHGVPWARLYLLKPNHAVSLALVPWMLRAFASADTWRARLWAGVLLHVVAWAFALNMALACIGLAAFVLLSVPRGRAEWRAALALVATGVLLNVLIASPYLWMLFQGFTVLASAPRLRIHEASPHLLEAVGRMGWLVALAVWGAFATWRQDRMSRLWIGQAVGALAAWLGLYLLSAWQQAKELDDIFYWFRFTTSVLAARGAWHLAQGAAQRLGPWLRRPAAGSPAWAAALLALAVLPRTLPWWWDPPRMDPYFEGSRAPLPRSITRTAELLSGLEPQGVLGGDPAMARWMAALTGRRLLIAAAHPDARDYVARHRLNDGLLAGNAEVLSDLDRWGLRYIVVTRRLLSPRSLTLEDLARRPYLRRLGVSMGEEGDLVALYAVERPGP